MNTGPVHRSSNRFGLKLLPVVLVALCLWLIRFDYTWATGDQDEFVPYVLHLLDTDVLAHDWFVQTQTQAVGVRTGFVWLLRVLCFLFTPGIAVAILYIVTWVLIGLAIGAIIHELRGSYGGAAVAIIVGLLLTPKWTLGGNDLVYTMLVPEMTAWSAALFGVLAFLRGRFAVAGLLTGLSALVQLLVGVHVTLVLAVAHLVGSSSPSRVREILVMCGTATLAAAPIALPILFQQLSGIGATSAGEPSEIEILAHIRAPYHYLPSAFSIGSYVKFGAVLATGLASALVIKQRLHEDQRIRVLLISLAVIAVLCITAWLLSEVYEVPLVVKLQLFKTTVVAKVVCIVLLGSAIPKPAWLALSSRVRPGIWAVATAISCIVVLLLVDRSMQETPTSSFSGVELWAKDNTELHTVFAIPPSISSFRSRAQRPIVVNYAAVPFRPEDLREWYARLCDLAPLDDPVRGITLKAQLDDSYHNRTLEDWQRLQAIYGIDYFVVAQDIAAEYALPLAYQNMHWRVYRLSGNPTSS